MRRKLPSTNYQPMSRSNKCRERTLCSRHSRAQSPFSLTDSSSTCLYHFRDINLKWSNLQSLQVPYIHPLCVGEEQTPGAPTFEIQRMVFGREIEHHKAGLSLDRTQETQALRMLQQGRIIASDESGVALRSANMRWVKLSIEAGLPCCSATLTPSA